MGGVTFRHFRLPIHRWIHSINQEDDNIVQEKNNNIKRYLVVGSIRKNPAHLLNYLTQEILVVMDVARNGRSGFRRGDRNGEGGKEEEVSDG